MLFQFTALRGCLLRIRQEGQGDTVEMATECQPMDAAILILHRLLKAKSRAQAKAKIRDLDEGLRCCKPLGLTIHCFVAPSRWRYDRGKHDGNRHHSCDHMEGSTVGSSGLAHIGNQ